MKISAIVVGALISASSALAAPVPVNVQVTLAGYNGSNDTYSASVHVTANPCPGVNIDTFLNVPAKNADEARDKTKADIAKITKDANEEAAHCGTH